MPPEGSSCGGYLLPTVPSDAPTHVTVLRDAVRDLCAPQAGALVVDVTLGAGGHSEALLDASPGTRLVGLDRDPAALALAGERLARFGDRVELHNSPFSSLLAVLAGRLADALVADLGVSSLQLDDRERGMSFRRGGPLDMRMGNDTGRGAWRLVRELREDQLADTIFQYGEERASRPIAKSIRSAVQAGKMESTLDLAEAVYRVLGRPRPGRIDPATRTFQAIRIAVNDELGQLDTLLASLPDALADGGVAAVISFHSLEDRAVKHSFRDAPGLEVLTKHPLTADDREVSANPRSRSAKLRGARRIPRGTHP